LTEKDSDTKLLSVYFTMMTTFFMDAYVGRMSVTSSELILMR